MRMDSLEAHYIFVASILFQRVAITWREGCFKNTISAITGRDVQFLGGEDPQSASIAKRVFHSTASCGLFPNLASTNSKLSGSRLVQVKPR